MQVHPLQLLEPDSGKISSSSQDKKSANFSHEDLCKESEESAPDKEEDNGDDAENADKKEEIKEVP